MSQFYLIILIYDIFTNLNIIITLVDFIYIYIFYTSIYFRYSLMLHSSGNMTEEIANK